MPYRDLFEPCPHCGKRMEQGCFGRARHIRAGDDLACHLEQLAALRAEAKDEA